MAYLSLIPKNLFNMFFKIKDLTSNKIINNIKETNDYFIENRHL